MCEITISEEKFQCQIISYGKNSFRKNLYYIQKKVRYRKKICYKMSHLHMWIYVLYYVKRYTTFN
jgi:hypothetical protein